MRSLIAAVATLTLGIACAPAALADPASDADQYDQYMISHGMTDGPSGYTLEYLLQAGYDQCALLEAGNSERTLIGALQMNSDRASSENIVQAAHRYLCPGA